MEKQNNKDCLGLLTGKDNLLLLTHRNPDGDTVGSAAALCSALRRAGKTAYLYKNVQITEKLLPYCEKFFAPEEFAPDYTVAVDIATENLFPNGFSGRVELCIDHHPTNSHYASNWLVRAEKASCGEIVYELIMRLHGSLTPEEANLLYIAVTTDTGCFQYANTTPDTLRTAADILAAGADNREINVRFFRKVSAARLKLEGMIYSGMSFYRDGLIAVACITLDMLEKSGAKDNDLDDLAGLPGRSEKSLLNVTIREQTDGNCRVSLRSGKEVSSSDICAVFGGGGHAMAAGCTIKGSADKVKEMLLAVIDEVWK